VNPAHIPEFNQELDRNRQKPGMLDSIARKFVLGRMRQLEFGSIRISDEIETRRYGVRGKLDAAVTVSDFRFYSSLALGGALGAAEAYMLGYWNCDDLTTVIRILVRNRSTLEKLDSGLARLSAPLARFAHWINRNTKRGSRRNIAAHYDLGNDFFKLWLDESMMYSAAVFERDDMTLEQASLAKLDRICRKLQLSPDDHVLEIGTGWGGFAVYAAENYGCRITTTTISAEQFACAKERVNAAGLQDRVTLLLEDYRELEGAYDKIVSIEMIEAVGHKYLDTYFSRCSKLLKPNGMMLLQAITIADQRYQAALRSVDFIQKYIFPGGFLPSVTALAQSLTGSTDMRMFHLEDIGPHYADTLRHWKERFHSKLDKIWSMEYGEEFLRMWHYYYCYCEGAFIERAIGNVQVLLVKPDCRREPIVPPLFQSGVVPTRRRALRSV
jgi:cyclopropane-fatty-acyl-phospholipid synthase